MKIKTLKIKVEKDDQEIDFSEFLEGSNVIYKTKATLQKEKDGHYWHVFFTFEPKSDTTYVRPIPPQKVSLPEGFEDAIMNYLEDTQHISSRIFHAIRGNLEGLLRVHSLENFKLLSKLGKKSIEDNPDFFQGLLNIIEKYR
jgi:hypothetical protein